MVPLNVPVLPAGGAPNAGHGTEGDTVGVGVVEAVEVADVVPVAVTEGGAPTDSVADGEDVIDALAVPVWLGDGVVVDDGVGSTYV